MVLHGGNDTGREYVDLVIMLLKFYLLGNKTLHPAVHICEQSYPAKAIVYKETFLSEIVTSCFT